MEEESSQLAPCCCQSGAGGLPEDGQLGQLAVAKVVVKKTKQCEESGGTGVV